MSRENVELVRRWFAAIAEGDLASELWDADLIVDNIPEFPVVGPYRGYEGLRRWWDDLAEVVEGARVQLDKATRLDDDKVLTIQRLIGDMTSSCIGLRARAVDTHGATSAKKDRETTAIHAVGSGKRTTMAGAEASRIAPAAGRIRALRSRGRVLLILYSSSLS